MKTSPTMQDIAEKASVSRMTVSLALRNDPRLKAETRRRIQSVARRMGYQPNPLVSALMANIRGRKEVKRKVLLGFVAHEGWRQAPAMQRFIEGAGNQAANLGYQMDCFWIGGKTLEPRQLSRILYARGVSGIIVSPLYEPGQELDIDWELFAAAAIGYSMPRPELHRASNHQLHSISMALRKLNEAGCGRIGLALARSHDVRVDHNWMAGFLVHQQLSGARKSGVPMLLADRWERKAFVRWFCRYRPDAVVSIHLEALDWLKETGVDVPGQTAFAHLHWEPEFGDVAGVDQNSRLVGAAALDLVVNQLHRNERGVPEHPKVVLVEGRWRAGETVPRPGRRPPGK